MCLLFSKLWQMPPSPLCSSHLGSEPENGNLTLILSLPAQLCFSSKQTIFSFCFILKICLFENKVTEIQRQRQRDLPCIDSFPRCPLWPRLCQAEARRQELHLGLRCGLNHYLLLARCISRKLDQKRSSQDLNMHSFVEGLRPRKQLSALYH